MPRAVTVPAWSREVSTPSPAAPLSAILKRVRPRLVLVRGTQGSGKTVLAMQLSELLGWRVLHREDFRNAAASAIGSDVRPKSVEALQAVHDFYQELNRTITVGASLIADSTFPSGVCEPDLEGLVDRSHLASILCSVPRAVALERCAKRPNSGTLIELLQKRNESVWRRFEEPLLIPIPQLLVDTSDGYAPSLDVIATWAGEGNQPTSIQDPLLHPKRLRRSS